MVGDVMLGRLVNETLRSRGPALPGGTPSHSFRQADWSFCNLECVVSDRVPFHLPDKTFQFRSDHKNAAVLKAAGIDAVSVANNHSLDFGEDAMLDMLATLDAKGIGHAGAGATLEEAMHPRGSAGRRLTSPRLRLCESPVIPALQRIRRHLPDGREHGQGVADRSVQHDGLEDLRGAAVLELGVTGKTVMCCHMQVGSGT
jgi:poly-gamma-glutamate capsule biosynthesis protein CapA/YwtB (metallophosphatase superfamily)